MQQIVLNLLSNAVKFTESGGSIAVSATPRGNCIDVVVKDTGIGIPEEKIDKVFDPFVQAGRQLNQPAQGVGLGLAISRDLARAMNGEITLDSTVGKGSTFTLSLPRAPRMDPADVAAATAAALGNESPPTSANGGELADRPLHETAHP
jgi:signal transduction histidine kinase